MITAGPVAVSPTLGGTASTAGSLSSPFQLYHLLTTDLPNLR